VVVIDQRSPRDGRFIEAIGKYHPLDDPSLIEIDEDRALDWLRKGAQPSDPVRTLLDKVGVWERFVAERPAAAVREHRAGARTRARWEASAEGSAAPAAAVAGAEQPAAEPVAAEEPAAQTQQPPATEAPAAEEQPEGS
jgi:small subunit ribosomal protein S16